MERWISFELCVLMIDVSYLDLLVTVEWSEIFRVVVEVQ